MSTMQTLSSWRRLFRPDRYPQGSAGPQGDGGLTCMNAIIDCPSSPADCPMEGIFAMTKFGLTPAEFPEMVGDLVGRDARCLNPACEARLAYRETSRGRQALYCDDTCRRSTWRTRAKLEFYLHAVIESHDLVERPATALELRSAEAKIRWLLARYPSEPESEARDNEGRFVDHVPAAVVMAHMDDHWTDEALAEAGLYDARMRLKYMNRRTTPRPVTPTLVERQRAAVARQQRLNVERLLVSSDT